MEELAVEVRSESGGYYKVVSYYVEGVFVHLGKKVLIRYLFQGICQEHTHRRSYDRP